MAFGKRNLDRSAAKATRIAVPDAPEPSDSGLPPLYLLAMLVGCGVLMAATGWAILVLAGA